MIKKCDYHSYNCRYCGLCHIEEKKHNRCNFDGEPVNSPNRADCIPCGADCGRGIKHVKIEIIDRKHYNDCIFEPGGSYQKLVKKYWEQYNQLIEAEIAEFVKKAVY